MDTKLDGGTPAQSISVKSETTRDPLATLADLLVEVVARVDAEGRHLFVNRAGASLYGRPAPQIIGQRWRELGLPKELCASWEARLREVLAGSSAEHLGTDTIVGPTGPRIFKVRFAREPLGPDGLISALLVAHDVTGHRGMQLVPVDEARALRDSEERHRSVFSSMSEGVVVHSHTGEITMCNAAAEKILGLSLDQLAGRTPFDPGWQAVHPDGSPFPPELHPAMVALRENRSVREVLMGVHAPDRTRSWLLVNAEPIRVPSGAADGVVATFTNVTERLRTETRLKEVLEGGTDGFWERNLTTGQVFRSARMNEILGLPAVDSHSPVDSLFAVVHPDDLQAQRELLTQVQAAGSERFTTEFRVRRPDGGWRWVASRGKVVERGPRGIVVRMAGTFRDIDLTRVAERALATSERRYRELVELSPAPIFINRHNRVAFANRAALELWGASTPEQLLGKPVLELFAPVSRLEVADRIGRVRKGHRVLPAYQQIVRLDGTTREVQGIGSVFHDDEGGIQVLLRDVTEERLSAAVLATSEARFRALADEAPAGVFETDPKGQVRYLNHLAQALVGPKVRCWFDAVHPDDRPRVREEWARPSSGVRTSEYRVLTPSGQERLVRTELNAVRDAEGNAVGFTGVVIDMTERHALLEQFVINARLAALGTFVAGLAHEVNNPLSAVVSAQEWVLDALERLQGKPGRLPSARLEQLPSLEEVTDVAQEAQDSAERIARIVKDLEILGRPDETRTRVPPRELVDQVLTWLPAFLHNGASIAVEGTAPDVLVSRGQLAQVLINLTTNATQAIPEGRPGSIVVRLGAGAPGMARIEVSDDGVGITPEVLTRIFDPFFTTREVRQGTGLGLPVVHALVVANGGSISVTSHPGRGSTFRVELPTAP